MPALISGSLAFDTIMNFEGKFSDQILADHIHKLNVSFFVPKLRREAGGCAGNIAYALKQLGGEPLPMATYGSDGADYAKRFEGLGISTEFLGCIDSSHTALAMIMTDIDNNQITAFHPGAMSQAHSISVPANAQSSRGKIALGIVSPNGREAMVQHAQQMHAAGIPFIFDPGQGLPMFDGTALREFIDQATWVTVNDYEGEMLSARTGMSFAEMSGKTKGVVVTLGENGCDVWQNGEATRVAPVKASAVVDPTGCGDAFRGALLFGLERGWDLVRCCALGNRIGALKIAQRGGQNYQLEAGFAAAA